MSNPAIQSLPLADLRIPGTHDSGSYSLSLTLSEIKYANIALLWQLSPDPAPADGSMPWSRSTLYLGPSTYDYVMKTVLATAQSQDRSIGGQLEGGIRYFDFRIYYDEGAGDFYVQHGLRGTTLKDMVGQIASFFAENTSSSELVILELSHTNFASTTRGAAWCTEQVTDILSGFGESLYVPDGASGAIQYSLQNIANLTVADITSRSGTISPAINSVLVLNTDYSSYTYASGVVNTPGFASSNRGADGVDQVSDLIAAEGDALQNNPAGNLYQVAWTLTPQAAGIIAQVQNALGGASQAPLLQTLATAANNALPDFLSAHQNCQYNLVTVDWYEIGSPQAMVEILVDHNELSAKNKSDVFTHGAA